jgi:hypothetical protein
VATTSRIIIRGISIIVLAEVLAGPVEGLAEVVFKESLGK